MSYKLNKTNGELLVDLVDGQLDITSTDISLVGRNYRGYGEAFNENLIKLLENFAKTSAPGTPLIGQLWYDTAEQRLKVYTGDTFRSAAGAVVSQTQPNLVAGDLWIDSLNNKLYFFDGTDTVLVGPQYTASQGKTGTEAFTILDENGQDQTVLQLYINGSLTGIYSKSEFRPRVNIVGFPVDADDNRVPKRQIIRIGFNPASTSFWFRGTAQSSRGLVSDAGEEFQETNFMKTDRNTSTTGSLAVKNAGGLTVGVSDTVYAALKIDNNYITTLETQRIGRDFTIRTRRGNLFDNAFYADSDLKRVGIYTTTPQVDFDVVGDGRFSGDLEVQGNLTIQGDTTYLNVSSLRVEDKNIELGLMNDSAIGDDAVVDGAGVIIRSTDGNKSLTWENETGSWTLSEDLDLATGKTFNINNVTKLSTDRLHDSVLYATGLIQVGSLSTLTVVGNVTINDNLISSNALAISSNGTITINNQLITGADTPTSARVANNLGGTEDLDSSVATKGYVDQEISAEPVTIALDATGMVNPSSVFSDNIGPHEDIKDAIEYLYPAAQKQAGSYARVYATSYIDAPVTGIDVNSAITKTTVNVYVDPDDSSTPEFDSVLKDITISSVSGSANLSPSRAKVEFQVVGGVWQWQRTIPV
jgi:hypothetical protein|tara:strand:+ start:1221 stop:3149 length:1929 start_codon:yes stop_codon:yes gene_type:complete